MLSVAVPTAATTTLISRAPVTSATATTTRPVLTGTTINAITDQSFRAVIGTIRNLKSLPSGYTLHGDIDWGDGTAHSDAKFVRQSDGSIAVIGDHTYSGVGGEEITVVVSAVPPPWSEAPVRLIGTIHSKANVIAPNGGVTLSETVGVAFTERLGFFRSSVAPSTMKAVINWADGSQSEGKIVPLPTAGPVPTYAVEGSHTYAATGSYLVHVTVYSSQPGPTTSPTAAPVYLVAQFDSVIDVLPRINEIQ